MTAPTRTITITNAVPVAPATRPISSAPSALDRLRVLQNAHQQRVLSMRVQSSGLEGQFHDLEIAQQGLMQQVVAEEQKMTHAVEVLSQAQLARDEAVSALNESHRKIGAFAVEAAEALQGAAARAEVRISDAQRAMDAERLESQARLRALIGEIHQVSACLRSVQKDVASDGVALERLEAQRSRLYWEIVHLEREINDSDGGCIIS